MKKIMMLLLSLAVLINCSFFSPQRIFAKENDGILVKIPIVCEGNTKKYTCDKFIYEIDSIESDAVSHYYYSSILRLKEGEKGSYELHFYEPGTYTLKVFQQDGADEKHIQYDYSEYIIKVIVTQGDSGLISETVVYKNGSNEKVDTIRYENLLYSSMDSIGTEKPGKTKSPTVTKKPKEKNSEKTSNLKKPERTKVPIIKKNASPKTGDRTNIFLWSVLFVLSAGCIVFAFLKKKK